MKHTFKKHMTADDFKVGYYVNDKFQKFINVDKPFYVEWCEDNTPEEIPYVAPPPSPPVTTGQLRSRATKQVRSIKYDALYDRLWKESQEFSDFQTEKTAISTMTKPQVIQYIKDLDNDN